MPILCNASHPLEYCTRCGDRWETHQNHTCYRGERGIFPGCVGVVQAPKEPPKVEPLPVYVCQQGIAYYGACDEVATFRVSQKGLSITVCEAHAEPYLSGAIRIIEIPCAKCRKVCKPGSYVLDRQSESAYCSQVCHDLDQTGSSRSLSYAN